MASVQEQFTVAHVIDMFKGLNLLVTGDGQQIEAKSKELEPRYLRMKNSPDRQKGVEADLWFKNLSYMKSQRTELLDIVYKHFAQLADTTLEAALLARTKQLTPELYSQLERLALEQCKCDTPLAQRFVETYLQDKGLTIGTGIVPVNLVERLTAISSVGQVELHWQLPSANCDEMFLNRFAATKQGGFEKSGQELCRGRLSSYTDRNVKAGQSYRYEIHSIYKQVESQTGVEIKAVAIGEVSDFKLRWVKDHVELTWQKPSPDCKVYLFRAPSAIPPAQRGRPDPLPNNPEAKLIFQGTASTWADREVTVGQEYHYLLVAFFGPDHFSNGVSVSILTPIPPPTVTAARAEYQAGAVHIRWEGVQSRQRVEYVVLRTSGLQPAASPTEGSPIATTTKTYCQDATAENGCEYTYTIFTYRDEIYSRQGRSTEPVAVVAEVRDITVETGDGSVTLRWQKPPEASQVIVRRSPKPLPQPGEGTLVPLAGPGLAQDTGLDNDREYHYLIYCSYRMARGREVFSPGVQWSAIPRQLPGQITGFAVTREGNQIVCAWEQEGPGTVLVVRTRQPSPYAVGVMLNDQELSQLGHRLSIAKTNQALDAHPTPAEPYYTAFVVAGSYGRAGPWQQCVAADDVSNLRLTAELKGVRLRWTWPEHCLTVTIARGQDNWPTGIDDPLASRFHCSRSEYESHFNSYLDQTAGTGKVFYIVYAQPSAAPERVFAPGSSPGCRGFIQAGGFGQLKYSLKIERQHRFFGPYILVLKWEFVARPGRFSGFRLIGNPRAAPVQPTEGTELFCWTPAGPELLPTTPQEIRIQLNNLQGVLGQRFYCRLFHFNLDEAEQIVIVHPDLNHPLEIR